MSEKNEQPALNRVPDMEAAIAAVAVNVTTPRAAVCLLGAVYDAVFFLIDPLDRKRWRTPRELLDTGWSDVAAMTAADSELHQLADFLIVLSERFRGRPGNAFASVVVGLAHLATLMHTVQRRIRELREAQATAGGGDLTDGAESPQAA